MLAFKKQIFEQLTSVMELAVGPSNVWFALPGN